MAVLGRLACERVPVELKTMPHRSEISSPTTTIMRAFLIINAPSNPIIHPSLRRRWVPRRPIDANLAIAAPRVPRESRSPNVLLERAEAVRQPVPMGALLAGTGIGVPCRPGGRPATPSNP
jgi:hypothetical protein